MTYLFMFYPEEALPAVESDAFQEAYQASASALRESGYLLAAASLHGGSPSLTLRVQDGELSLTDGPFAGAGPQPGALYIVEARDLNEAIRLAADMPQARRGRIEITPLQ